MENVSKMFAGATFYKFLVLVLLIAIMIIVSVSLRYNVDVPEDVKVKLMMPTPVASGFTERMTAPGGYMGGSLNTLRDDTGSSNVDSLAEAALLKTRFTEPLIEAGREMNVRYVPTGEDLATIMALQNSGNPAGFRSRLSNKKPEEHVNYS